MIETPSALISGAMRGASRNLRYAKRSMPTPRRPQPSIAKSSMHATTNQPPMNGSDAPPSHWSMNQPRNAPIMYTSPWAKFRSLRIPYTIE